MEDTAINHASPSKLYNHFLFKPLLVVVLVVVLAHFLSESISHFLHTGGWEFLQLIFVGIAVSYGLFSKKGDDDTEYEFYTSSKIDNNAQSFSSFFDDENKVQTWNNQYHSSKPVVVVAKESCDLEKHRAISSRFVEKPLLLPIRSLKSPVPPEAIPTKDSPVFKASCFHTKSEEQFHPKGGDVCSLSTSPKCVTPTQSILSPIMCCSLEDSLLRKKSFLNSSPPPPPPPPPRPKRSTQLNLRSIATVDEAASYKELSKSIRSVPMELTYSEKWKPPRKAFLGTKLWDGNQTESLYNGKSVRTIRPFMGAARARVYGQQFINGKEERSNTEVEETFVENTNCIDKLLEFRGDDEKRESVENSLLETDEESELENEEHYFEESIEIPSKSGGGPDVDKKADEFIAKFRKQIRLQRIDSVR